MQRVRKVLAVLQPLHNEGVFDIDENTFATALGLSEDTELEALWVLFAEVRTAVPVPTHCSNSTHQQTDIAVITFQGTAKTHSSLSLLCGLTILSCGAPQDKAAFCMYDVIRPMLSLTPHMHACTSVFKLFNFSASGTLNHAELCVMLTCVVSQAHIPR